MLGIKEWQVFEELIRNGVISNDLKKDLDPIQKSLYDDGSIKISNSEGETQ